MNRILPYLVLAAAAAFALSPFFVTSFAGFDPNQFPVPQDRPPVQPSGYAFSIWGLIYLWLVAGTGFGAARRADDQGWKAHRPPLLASLGIGIFWLALANWSPVAATVAIWAMLAGALLALFRTSREDRWLQQAPVAVYAGWLTAASSVSVGLILAGYGYSGETLAAFAALAVALALAMTVQLRIGRAPEYGLAVAWALAAVVAANLSPLNATVAGLAALGCAMMLAAAWKQAR